MRRLSTVYAAFGFLAGHTILGMFVADWPRVVGGARTEFGDFQRLLAVSITLYVFPKGADAAYYELGILLGVWTRLFMRRMEMSLADRDRTKVFRQFLLDAAAKFAEVNREAVRRLCEARTPRHCLNMTHLPKSDGEALVKALALQHQGRPNLAVTVAEHQLRTQTVAAEVAPLLRLVAASNKYDLGFGIDHIISDICRASSDYDRRARWQRSSWRCFSAENCSRRLPAFRRMDH